MPDTRRSRVGGDADHSHQNRTQHRPDQGALTALVLAVHQAGAQHEHSPQDEVAELTHSGTGAEGQVQQVLHQLDHHAVYRAQGKRPQQGGQVRNVQLHKAGDQGDGKLHELQHRGHGAEHGGYRQAMGSFACLRHKKKRSF